MKAEKKDLAGKLIQFGIPLVFSGLLQQLYNWADAFILGNIEGELALAAIGATTSVSEFLVLMITGFSVGISILAAHTYGNRKKGDIQKILSVFSVLSGLVFTAVGILCVAFTPQLVSLLQTPDGIASDAETYIRIIFLGIPCIAMYNMYSAVLRGIGDSRIPLYSIAISVLANIVLDVIFIGVFRLGVKGAAAATVLSQWMLLFTITICTASKYPALKLRWYGIRESSGVLKKGLALGLPTALQSSITACGNIVLQKFLNSFGAEVVAAITVAYRIDGVIMLPIVNLGAAISTIVAQDIGAGQKERAKKNFQIGIWMMVVIAALLSLLTEKASTPLIRLFHLNGEAIEAGQCFFHIITRFYVFYGIAVAIKGYLEGKGDVIFSGMASVLTLGVRILLSYGLRGWYGTGIIAYAEVFSWLFLLLACLWRFRGERIGERRKRGF